MSSASSFPRVTPTKKTTTGQQAGRRRSDGSPRCTEREPQVSPRRRHNKIYHCPPTPPPSVRREKEKGFVLDSVASSSLSMDYSKANPKLGQVIPSYNALKDVGCSPYLQNWGVSRLLKRTMIPDSTQFVAAHRSKAVRPIPHLDLKEQTTMTFPYTSTEGYTVDRFYRQRKWNGTDKEVDPNYLVLRNRHGSGHSVDVVGGHDQFMRQRQNQRLWFDPRTRQIAEKIEQRASTLRQEQGSAKKKSPYKEPVLSYNGRFGYRRNTPWLRNVPSQFGVATYSTIH